MRARVLVSLFLFSSLAYTAVWANNANGAVRGVSYGGKLCYLSSFMGTNNQVGFFQETVDTDNWMGPWTQYPDPTATIKLPKDWSFQNRTFQNEYGQGVVLFGAQLINVAIALDSKGNPWVVVTRYDLTKNEFLDCRGVLQLDYTRNDGYGVAATALNGNVYVFTGRFTLVSEDGYNYSQLSAVADGLSDYEAMDAVTFYPPEGPSKVLIAFSKRNSNDKAGYVIWDGSTLPMASSAFRTIGNDNEWYQAGATMLGTVKATQKYGCDFPSGNKHACVQLLLTAQSNFLPGSGWYVERYEYDTTTDTLQAMGRCPLTTPLIQFRAYPWFQTTPDSPDLGEFYVQEQLLVLNIWVCSGVNDCSGWHWNNFPLPSDFMVPQNQDTALGGYGWQGLPTSTVVSPQTPPDDIATYTTYWSLAGVVLGPPPFKTNGIQDSFELHDLSNVEYGMDSQNSLTHTVSWANSTMFSCQTEMKVGLGKKAGISSSFDLTYKQGWEGKNKDTTTYGGSISTILGTESESDPDWGTHGYAIFVVPLLLTQDMAIYAYDYDFTTQTGTPLDQDLTTIVQAGSTDSDRPSPRQHRDQVLLAPGPRRARRRDPRPPQLPSALPQRHGLGLLGPDGVGGWEPSLGGDLRHGSARRLSGRALRHGEDRRQVHDLRIHRRLAGLEQRHRGPTGHRPFRQAQALRHQGLADRGLLLRVFRHDHRRIRSLSGSAALPAFADPTQYLLQPGLRQDHEHSALSLAGHGLHRAVDPGELRPESPVVHHLDGLGHDVRREEVRPEHASVGDPGADRRGGQPRGGRAGRGGRFEVEQLLHQGRPHGLEEPRRLSGPHPDDRRRVRPLPWAQRSS